MIRVLIADDQALIRQAVSGILDADDDIEVVGQAVDGADAVRRTAQLRPDVVLMDIRMPGLDGIGATTQICDDPDNAGAKVLILTTFEEDEYVVGALRAGASGFLGKGAEPDEIVRAVHAVFDGNSLLSPAATRGLIARYLASPDRRPPHAAYAPGLDTLTEREREVLLLVARGKPNQEIAEDLFISPHTAKTHVNRIMTKVYAHDRAQLVVLAYEGGLLIPGENG